MVSVAQARKQAPGESLLDGLHDDRGIAALGFGEQQVNVLGHDHVSDYHKTIASPHLVPARSRTGRGCVGYRAMAGAGNN
jgi:hypothetical protein